MNDREDSPLRRLGWLLAAAALHAAPAVAVIVTPPAAAARRAVPIELDLFEPPPPPPPTPRPVQAKAPEVKEPEPAAEVPRPAPRPAARRRAAPRPAAAPKAAAPAPRRIVGLSLGSTVRAGGPAFAVGNALEGRTEAVAAAPSAAPAPPPTPRSLNRRATRPAASPEGAEVTRPRRTKRVQPEYPAHLRARGVEADVVVQVELTRRGTVRAARILRPAPDPAFDRAALAAAKLERFEPARRDGRAIEYTLSFTYRFRASG